jgi:uncharacterized protein (TIGR01777 family)
LFNNFGCIIKQKVYLSKKIMVVLVTGATGLIGKALVDQLLKKNHKVHYLTTSPQKIQNKSNYKGFLWNPAKHQLDAAALDGVEVIFHLAGATIAKRWTAKYKNEILSSRIDTAQTLYKALQGKSHLVRQLIAASGTAIYPNNTQVLYTENSDTHTAGFLSEVVVQWEKQTALFSSLGIKVCQLRTAVVFAAQGGALPQMAAPIKLGVGSVMGSGKQIQSWIHVNDVVGLYLFAMENEWLGVYNAVAPEVISNRDQTLLMAKILKRPLWLPPTPKWVMQLVLGEMHQLLFTDTQISAQKAIDAGYVFQFPTANLALRNCLN